jgi:hypothetical protein
MLNPLQAVQPKEGAKDVSPAKGVKNWLSQALHIMQDKL